VLKRLKANEATRGIPVVICSVVRRKKRVVEGLDAGAVDYLTKPFEVEELFARVGSALMMREIDLHTEENERLETLRDVAQAVADEIRPPLEEIRRHAAALGASPEIEETENTHVVESVSRSVDQIDRILEGFR
jgi:DNA-binding response OmpR family regulator